LLKVERIEVLHVPLLQDPQKVSFGLFPGSVDGVDDAHYDKPEPEAVGSFPESLFYSMDRTQLPLLRTLAFASLDFSLESHRLGSLVARHGYEMGKLGIRIVDRCGVEFGEERDGWMWGKWVEKKESDEEEEREGEGGEVVSAGLV